MKTSLGDRSPQEDGRKDRWMEYDGQNERWKKRKVGDGQKERKKWNKETKKISATKKERKTN